MIFFQSRKNLFAFSSSEYKNNFIVVSYVDLLRKNMKMSQKSIKNRKIEMY
jgi:hypothetical protein